MRSYLPVVLACLAYPLVSEATELQDAGMPRRTAEGQTNLERRREKKLAMINANIMEGDFDDNTQGFCLFRGISGLTELRVTELLFNSHVEDVDFFLDEDGSANFFLIDLVDATNSYLPPDLVGTFTDREILSSIMIMNAEGPDRIITQACADAMFPAMLQSLYDFLTLMRIGDSFEIPDNNFTSRGSGGRPFGNTIQKLEAAFHDGDDQAFHEPVDTGLALSHILLQMEREDIFDRFINTILGVYEAFAAQEFFDVEWIRAVKSWEELALTPMSIVGKYAAVQLTRGTQLAESFATDIDMDRLEGLYDAALDACIMPTPAPSPAPTGVTEAPSASPSIGSETLNRYLPVISVIDFTMATADEILTSWGAFRTAYPDRFFCLLQPRQFDGDDIHVPREFIFDGNTEYVKISLDGGDEFLQSDWYDRCGLIAYEGSPIIQKVPIYLGLNEDDVEASLAFFDSMVVENIGTAPRAGPGMNKNWIDPLNVDF